MIIKWWDDSTKWNVLCAWVPHTRISDHTFHCFSFFLSFCESSIKILSVPIQFDRQLWDPCCFYKKKSADQPARYQWRNSWVCRVPVKKQLSVRQSLKNHGVKLFVNSIYYNQKYETWLCHDFGVELLVFHCRGQGSIPGKFMQD